MRNDVRKSSDLFRNQLLTNWSHFPNGNAKYANQCVFSVVPLHMMLRCLALDRLMVAHRQHLIGHWALSNVDQAVPKYLRCLPLFSSFPLVRRSGALALAISPFFYVLILSVVYVSNYYDAISVSQNSSKI